jgi:hypothetical protein
MVLCKISRKQSIPDTVSIIDTPASEESIAASYLLQKDSQINGIKAIDNKTKARGADRRTI